MTLAASTRYLRDYVAIPSVNPMGRSDLSADIAGEARYAGQLREQLRGLGLDAELVGDPARPSVVAEVRAAKGSPSLLVASHLDTVPVDDMEIDPFDPRIDGDRLYGRGACDTKAGMAALVAALERVLAAGRLRRNVVVVGEADEEYASVGVRDVMQHLGSKGRPDWVLATEPTDLRPVTRHKGIAVARLVAHGEACHSSNPGEGSNAIVTLSRAVLAMDELNRDLAGHADPRLGPGTLSVNVAGGGQALNIVPNEAWLLLDRRLLPGEDGETLRKELEASLAAHGLTRVDIAACSVAKGPLGTPDDHPLLRSCQDALARCGLSTEPATAAFATDAGVLESEESLPGIVMGPGSIAQAHTAREFVDLRQVEKMTEFFVQLLERPA
ncbi:MAG: M20/M25/M40 family metallo-hydrolase [Deltaproteobacteria bacterium]|nr:M20/M25/M40 family metallo-hydrolase [Deltaproteobacteria bacterium]